MSYLLQLWNCLYFICYGCGDHLYLHVLTHSFPTRRSSDLRPAAPLWRRAGVAIWLRPLSVRDVLLAALAAPGCGPARRAGPVAAPQRRRDADADSACRAGNRDQRADRHLSRRGRIWLLGRAEDVQHDAERAGPARQHHGDAADPLRRAPMTALGRESG